MTKPFQILAGGYQIVFKNGRWSRITASATKKEALAKEDRRGPRATGVNPGGFAHFRAFVSR